MKYHVGVQAPRSIALSRFPIILAIATFLFVSWFAAPALTYAGASKAHAVKKKQAAKKQAKRYSKRKHRRARRGVEAKAVYCVDLKNKQTLLARNPDKRLPVASLTKLVTALVALEHTPLNRKVTVPANIRKTPKSVVGLRPGDRVSVKDLLHGLLISSGNDCAEALAHAFPGGRKKFIRAMNRKVRAMGTKRTVFYNPSGLDIKTFGGGKNKKAVRVRSNVSTAREMALITRVAFANRIIRTICHKKSYVMASARRKGGYRIRTTNKLLRASNLPLVGGKTGYTCSAGHCLASAFTPGRNLFLIVVLGSPDHFRDTRLVYQKALRKTKAGKRGRVRRANPQRVALYYR